MIWDHWCPKPYHGTYVTKGIPDLVSSHIITVAQYFHFQVINYSNNLDLNVKKLLSALAWTETCSDWPSVKDSGPVP